MTNQIFISGLKLATIIGIYPEERLAPQPIVLDIELTADTQKAAISDNIADAIDYADVVKKLQERATKNQCQLVETLANDFVETLFQAFPKIQSIRLRLQKFPAGLPIASAGVIIVRDRG